MTVNSMIKNQELADAFCQDPENKDYLLYIENFDRFCFFQKEELYFKLFPYRQMERTVRSFLKKTTPKGFTMGTVEDVIKQSKLECYKTVPNFQSVYISFTDALYNTITQQIEPYNNQISFIKIPVSSEEFLNSDGIAPPMFQKFLNQVLILEGSMTPDLELHQLIQEIFGYCLISSTDAEASFFFVGEGSNGKSKLLAILKAMVGIENCSSDSIESLTISKHATASLIGKRLNICTEESSDFVKQDKFKTLVSGEPVQVEKKFQDSFSEILPVKFIFATNELPAFTGFNLGFLRRIKIIPFFKIFSDQEKDPQIANKIIAAELPQIYLWALYGMKRLLANSMQFSRARSASDKSSEFENALSSAVMFIREQYEESEGFSITSDELYQEYQKWCGMVGKKAMSKDRFSKEINRDLKLPIIWKPHPDTRKNSRARQLKERESEPGAPLQTVIDQLNIQF